MTTAGATRSPAAAGGSEAGDPSDVSAAEEHKPPTGLGLSGRQLFAIWFTQLVQGVQITMPMALAAYMVRFFEGPGADEQVVGRLTGLLAGSSTAAQCLTSYAWGISSDRIGRKPVMVVGNIAGAATMACLGLSGSYKFAIISRFVGGLFNGTGVAIKTMVGEACDQAGQARAMGLVSLSWGMGTVLGPLLAGFASHPCDIFGPSFPGCGTQQAIFAGRPFLLPCAIAVVSLLLAAVINVTMLRETLPHLRQRRPSRGWHWGRKAHGYDQVAVDDTLDSESHGDVAELELITVDTKPDTSSAATGYMRHDSDVALHRGQPPATTAAMDIAMLVAEAEQLGAQASTPAADVPHTEASSFWEDEDDDECSDHGLLASSGATAGELTDDGVGLRLPWYRQATVLLTLGGYTVSAFLFSYLDELTPLFASAHISQGGLGLPTKEFSYSLCFGGVVLVIFALSGYPVMQQALGLLTCSRVGQLIGVPMAMLIPFSSLWASQFWAAQGLLFLAQGLKALAATVVLTSSMILINVVSPAGEMGAVVGTGAMLASFVRAAGPILSGQAWAVSVALGLKGHQFLAFAVAAVGFACIQFLYGRDHIQLPSGYDRRH